MNRQNLAVLGILAALLVWGSLLYFKPTAARRSLVARELATTVLAEHLQQVAAGQNVVVLANSFIKSGQSTASIRETEVAGLRGLKKIFGARLRVVYPDLKPGALADPRAVLQGIETTTPLSFLLAEGPLDTLVRAQHGKSIIVSLIGLPQGVVRMPHWNGTGGPGWALLFPDFRGVATAAEVEAAMASGRLIAFVLRKPGGLADAVPLGKSRAAEFEQRFILVTRTNLAEMLRTQPALF